MSDRVQILIKTNAREEAKSIQELNAEMQKLVKSSQDGSPKSGRQQNRSLTQAFRARNREDLSRQSDLGAIRGSTKSGLTGKLDTATGVAAKLLKGTKGSEFLIEELKQGVGYALDENLRPLKQAAAALRKKASKTKNPEKATELNNYADEIDKYVGQYQKLGVSRKAALRALGEGAPLRVLEKAQTAFQKIGIEIGSISELSKFENRISAISPAIAGDVKALRKSFNKISTQDYLKELGAIAMRGVSTVRDQQAAYDKQIKDEVNSRAGKGGGFANVFEKRFGSAKDMLASGKKFDMSSLEDQAAFGVFKDNLRTGLGSYIKSQLDPKSLTGLTQLQTAKATGDTETIQAALKKAEKQVNTRLSRMREQLDKLADIAKATGDQDMLNIVNGYRRQIRAQGETLAANLTAGAAKVQQSLDKSLQKTMDDMVDKVRLARGTKTMTTKDSIGKLTDKTDEAIFQGISDFTNAFKKKSFQSLGGKTMEEAGYKRNEQNILNTQILGKTGFFSAKTQEERMTALDDSFQHIKPALMGVGLKGKELADAEDDMKRMLLKLVSIYGELANHTQGLNAEVSKEVRTKAARLVKEGKYDEARALINDPSKYVAADVNAGRPSQHGGGGKTGQAATKEEDLNPQARRDMGTNRDYVEGLIADREASPKNTFMGKLRTASAFAGSLLNVYGLVASAVGTVVNGIGSIIAKANELDKVASTVNALGGTFSNFSRAMIVATQQQALYGGTLQETLQGLTSLMPIAKRYSVDLGQLDNIARRLAVVDPLQGFQGASIALKEFFSGDITSLSRRFEIDRKSLNSIKEAGTQAEQLQALDKALNDMGISNDVLAAKTQTAAVSFDRAAAGWDNFITILGKSAQGTFVGSANKVADMFKSAGQELASLEEKEQVLIDIQKQMSKLAAKFKETGTVIKATGSELDRYTSGALFDPKTLEDQELNLGELVKQFNDLIEKLNEVRALEGKSRLSFFSAEDAEIIKELALISEQTGISVKVLLENRNAAGDQKNITERLDANNPGIIGNLLDSANKGLLLGLTNTEGGAQRDAAARMIGYKDYLGYNSWGAFNKPQISVASQLLPSQFDNTQQIGPELLGLVQNSGANNNMAANAAKLSYPMLQSLQGSSNQVDLLPDYSKTKQIENLKQTAGIDYVKTMEYLRNSMQQNVLTEEEANAKAMEMIALNNKLIQAREKSISTEDSYATNMAKSIQAFGSITAKDIIVKQLDDITQKNAERGQAILARAYGEAGGGASYMGGSEQIDKILEAAREKYNIDRETLYYQNEIQKRQAMMTLEANKSVSAYTALTNLTSGLGVNLQDAVKSAMEFNSQIQGIASGTIFGQLSLQDRLNLNSQYYQNVGGVGGPQNQGDITSNLAQGFSLLQEQASNAAASSGKETKTILEKYEKEKTKIADDGEKERTEIMEDWAESVKKLIRESEYTKRAATADFYEFLNQNDTLTKDQRDSASAQREGFFAEASSVRDEDPEKAANILSAGEQLVRNRVTAEEGVAKLKKDNVDIDEQIGELQRDLSKAKDDDARKDIQRKIDKLNEQKAININEIAQIETVYVKRKEADEQLLADARAGIDTEKTARDKAIQDSYDKEKENQRLLTKQKNDDVDALKKKQDENAAAQIMNLTDYQNLQRIGYAHEAAARMAANGYTSKDIQSYLDSTLGPIEKYFADKGTPAAKMVTDALAAVKAIPGSVYNGVNPALAGVTGGTASAGLPGAVVTAIDSFQPKTDNKTPDYIQYKTMPEAVSANVDATKKNTTGLQNLTTASQELTFAIRTFGVVRPNN